MKGEERVYAFGAFRVDPARRLLSKSGRPVRVTAKVFDLLSTLLDSQGRVLTREELMGQLWPDTVVEDGNLSVNVSALRKVLEDNDAERPIVETLPRVGYRFAADVSVARSSTSARGVETPGPPAPADEGRLRSTPLDEVPPVTQQARRAPALLPPFVGRDDEMKTLCDLFEVAASGEGQLVFIHGEPGIGKTTLAQHFVTRTLEGRAGARVAVGRCLQQHGSGEAYLPFLAAFGGLLSGDTAEPLRHLFRTHAPSWCQRFPAIFGPASAGLESPGALGSSGAQLQREGHDVVRAISAQAPLVLLLEDLQWADPSSIDLLGALSQEATDWNPRPPRAADGQRRSLIIGTFRAAEVLGKAHPLAKLIRELEMRGQCARLPLEALGRQPIDRYLQERFGRHEFPDELVALLMQKTHGHPLLFTRLTEWLVDRGDIAADGEAFRLLRPLPELHLEVPQSIESLILRKLDFLTLEEQRALNYASIEGDEFTSTIVAALMGVDDVDLEEHLDRLSRVHRWFDLVAEETWPSGTVTSRYRFSHALYRDYLHGRIVPKRRRQLHRAAALALIDHHRERAPNIAGQLAVHFEQSGDTARAVEYRIHAGHNARCAFASREAEAHCSRALRLAEGLPGDERVPLEIVLLGERAWCRYNLGSYPLALDDFTAMRALALQTGNPTARWGAVIGSAWTCLRLLDRAGCRANSSELFQIADDTKDERARTAALNFAAAISIDLDLDPERAREHLSESLELARKLDDEQGLVACLHLSSSVDFLQSRYGEAIANSSAIIERRQLSPFVGPETAVAVQYERGLAQLNLGSISAALADFEGARAFAERVQCLVTVGSICNSIAGVHLEIENYPEAMRRSREVLAMPSVRTHDYARLHAGLDLALALVRQPSPDVPAAVVELSRAEQFARHQELHCYEFMAKLRLHATRSELCLARAELSLAAENARQVGALASGQRAGKYVALSHWLGARVELAGGELSSARAALSLALDALERSPCPRIEWRVLADLGRTQIELAEFTAAQSTLERATAGLQQIALGIEDESLRDIFLRSPGVRRALEDAEDVG